MQSLYWCRVSPLIHCRSARVVIVIVLTGLFVFAPGYLPGGSLTFNVIP